MKRNVKNPDLLPLLTDYLYTTRTATRLAFAMLWQCMLDYLNLQDEGRAAKLLTTYYLQQEDYGFAADWRASPDRCVPSFGSGPGSQCQERWHGARLRPGLGDKSLEFGSFMQALYEFMGTRAEQAELQQNVRHMVPGLVWDHDLISGTALRRIGRTCVMECLEAKAYRVLQACLV